MSGLAFPLPHVMTGFGLMAAGGAAAPNQPDETSLQVPGQAMLIHTFVAAPAYLATTITGGTVSVKAGQQLITNGYVPIDLLGPDAYASAVTFDARQYWAWRLPRPFYLPFGVKLQVMFRDDPAGGTNANPGSEWYFAAYGTLLPESHIIPAVSAVPYLTAWTLPRVAAPTAAATQVKLNSDDLGNPFTVPLHVARFLFEQQRPESVAELPAVPAADPLNTRRNTTLQLYDAHGRPILRDPLNLFALGGGEGWIPTKFDLAPREAIFGVVDMNYTGFAYAAGVNPKIGMQGWRNVRLNEF